MWLEDSPYLRSTRRAVPDDQRKQRQRRHLLQFLLFFVLLILVFGVVVAGPYQYVAGTDSDPVYRANAIHLIHEEIQHLAPPYDGSTPIGTDDYNAPARPLGVIAYYSLDPGECQNAQTYYTMRAPQAGWSVDQPIMSHRDEYTGVVTTYSTYRKSVKGLSLQLGADCDNTASYGYELSIFVA
jgi:hypothetical protein